MKPTLGDSVVDIENENKIQIVTTHYFGFFDHLWVRVFWWSVKQVTVFK